MSLTIIRPPIYVLTCQHEGCVAQSPEAPDEETVEMLAGDVGWVSDSEGEDWCPAHAHLATHEVCVCRVHGDTIASECTEECREHHRRVLAPCPVCDRSLGLKTATCLDRAGRTIHVRCLKAAL